MNLQETEKGIIDEMFQVYDQIIKAYHKAQEEYYVASERYKREPIEERFLALQGAALTLMFSSQRVDVSSNLLDRANGYRELKDGNLTELLKSIRGLTND